MNRYFENNVYDGIETEDAIEQLHEIAGCIIVNALMTGNGKAEVCEKDAGAWWAIISLAEGALAGYPDDIRKDGFDIANENVNRELVEKARRDEAEQAAKRVMDIILGVKGV
ncbi:hypothetical protein [Paratractidigestivibacter sp.]|uniref:hypothetical protein n=1 Tax=Paratractidigestivibacter sp. TaxID=2847316 RepID=UPI002AC90F84|nr:hypothetical protein [Paratractidigestivibacter sp.]